MARIVIAAVVLLLANTTFAEPPDLKTWELASVPGPALFVGTLVKAEQFKDPPNASYACRRDYNDNSKGPQCISNGCGLERLTFRLDQAFAGSLPAEVVLTRGTGEWCDGTEAIGKKFVLAIDDGRTWGSTKVLSINGREFMLANYNGCLGDFDLKPLLRSSHISIAKHWRDDLGRWYLMSEGRYEPVCQGPLTPELYLKAISLSTFVQLWKTAHK
jgi:hypothetical protein